jgi:DNA-binding transcriptional LysR family regulator
VEDGKARFAGGVTPGGERMLTRGHRQEALCRAYARAVAAQAGLTVSEPENDYGIDMSFRAITPLVGQRRDRGPQLDLQLKDTTRANVGPSHLTYDLPVVNYDDLRDPNLQVARLLIVLVMPEDETLWLSQSPEELVLRHCAYWLSLKGLPPTLATTTRRVSLPLTQVFSVDAVKEIVQRLRERKDP